MAAAHHLDALRFPFRTAAFVGLTFGMYGLLEIDTARAERSEQTVVLHRWMRRYGRALLKLYGVEVRAGGPYVGAYGGGRTGAANGRTAPGEAYYPERDARGLGRLFVMNHRSALDVAMTLAFFEATIVSRADLARWPVVGMAARRAGTLFVDRSNKQSGSALVYAMISVLQRGHGVMVYPEGTTYADDEVRPFRPGGFVAACRVGAEIVPVGIAYGGAEASYIDEPFTAHMARISRARRTLVAIEVGSPIAAEGQNATAVSGVAQASVQTLVCRARAALARTA
jgi:1-acyl-sn-glycerol-3-phosphate acyltransferase